MERFLGLGGTFKPTQWHGQGRLPLSQGAPSTVQLDLGHCQGPCARTYPPSQAGIPAQNPIHGCPLALCSHPTVVAGSRALCQALPACSPTAPLRGAHTALGDGAQAGQSPLQLHPAHTSATGHSRGSPPCSPGQGSLEKENPSLWSARGRAGSISSQALAALRAVGWAHGVSMGSPSSSQPGDVLLEL